jgi:hypothetical protein
MKKLIAVAFLAGTGLFGVSASQAMPIPALDQTQAGMITKVADGCGPGFHRGPYGHCRPLFSCPPGWHTGPFGRRCFRNGW